MSAATAAVKSAKSASQCPISADEFLANAGLLEVQIAGMPMAAAPKLFSTGSFGFYCGGKVPLKVGGKLVNCQIGLNVTVIGSKK